MTLLIRCTGFAQRSDISLNIDSMRHDLSIATQDSSIVMINAKFSNFYKYNNPDSAFYYGFKAITLAQQIHFLKGQVRAMEYIALTQMTLGNYPKALQITLQGVNMAEKENLPYDNGMLFEILGRIYLQYKDYSRALKLFKQSQNSFESVNEIPLSIFVQNWIGTTYILTDQLDSATYYCNSANTKALPFNLPWLNTVILSNLGKIELKKGKINDALFYFHQASSQATFDNDLFQANLLIAKVYSQINLSDSCIYYAKESLDIAHKSGFYSNIIEAYIYLSGIYETINPQEALAFNRKAINYRDSLDMMRNNTALEAFTDFDEQQRQFELETARNEFHDRIRMNAFLGSTFTLMVIAIFLYIISRRNKKAKQKIESAYDKLKSTQAQLIQSEKMASLGELTAGIAHEIQNPLNFVNNFSEVNSELLAEMKEEIKGGNYDEVNAIADDVIENEQKINHHGKRAESIVKNMLQHSRSSSGVKEPTDINALADEYLRLSYHGFRAKDKSFNADFKLEADESLPKINVVPQDIGRVLLNLINNAFYAVDKRAKEYPLPPKGGSEERGMEYKPTVVVSTSSSKSPSGGFRGENSCER